MTTQNYTHLCPRVPSPSEVHPAVRGERGRVRGLRAYVPAAGWTAAACAGRPGRRRGGGRCKAAHGGSAGEEWVPRTQGTRAAQIPQAAQRGRDRTLYSSAARGRVARVQRALQIRTASAKPALPARGRRGGADGCTDPAARPASGRSDPMIAISVLSFNFSFELQF